MEDNYNCEILVTHRGVTNRYRFEDYRIATAIENLLCNIEHIDFKYNYKKENTLEQESKSEWQQDHEILRAYSDGANEVLEQISTEIAQCYCEVKDDYDQGRNFGLYITAQIIDRYRKKVSDI